MRLIIICFLWCNIVMASRGFYVSMSINSTKQNNTVQNYQSKTVLQPITNVNKVNSASISNTSYYFADDSLSNALGFVSFSSLGNASNNSYILTTQNFSLGSNSAINPTFKNGTQGVQINNNAGNNTKTAIHQGTGSTIGTITQNTTASHSVILNPISWNQKIIELRDSAQKELDTQLPFNSTAQLQKFFDAVQNKNRSGVEFSIGYKFRPFQSQWFFAPQVDVSWFDPSSNDGSALTPKSEVVAYSNANASSFSATKGNGHTHKITRDSLNMSAGASMVAKFGLERYLFLDSIKLHYSAYGFAGGASALRRYRDIRTSNFGFKYGLGGEVFLNRNLALFGEIYQIQFTSQTFDHSQTHTLGNSTEMQSIIDSGTGGSVVISNGGTGVNAKDVTINYASLQNSVSDIKYKYDESFKIKSNISAIKIGLTYYLGVQ